ncbi:MAG: YraN family protein [Minisyncoccia bacterium]
MEGVLFRFMYNKNFTREPTEKQKLGEIGENIVAEHLLKHGYVVVYRNYLRKWGEIDIVATKSGSIHFVEVKSVSRSLGDVTYETVDHYRAEDNMHPWKLRRLGRVIQSYLLDKNVSDETNWQLDLATVEIDKDKGLSRVSLLEDIVIG